MASLLASWFGKYYMVHRYTCVMLLNARMLIRKIWQAVALSEIVPWRHTEWPLEVASGGMELACCVVSLTLLACEHSCLFRLRKQTCNLTIFQIRNQFWAVFQKLFALKTMTRSRDRCKATTIEPTISTILLFSLPPWARPVGCVRLGRAKLEVPLLLWLAVHAWDATQNKSEVFGLLTPSFSEHWRNPLSQKYSAREFPHSDRVCVDIRMWWRALTTTFYLRPLTPPYCCWSWVCSIYNGHLAHLTRMPSAYSAFPSYFARMNRHRNQIKLPRMNRDDIGLSFLEDNYRPTLIGLHTPVSAATHIQENKIKCTNCFLLPPPANTQTDNSDPKGIGGLQYNF